MNFIPPVGAPEPSRTFFEPFQSSSTGHQRAENRLSGSASWRDSRAKKLAQQFRDSTGGGGDAHVADLVRAGSENIELDMRKKNGSYELGAPGSREKGLQDIRGFMSSNKKRKHGEVVEHKHEHGMRNSLLRGAIVAPAALHPAEIPSTIKPKGIPVPPQIFRSLTLYLNGSTLSFGISDHKLKSLFAQHGGSISIAFGRRTVTHVVLGSCGGGMAASKIQMEVTKVGGASVKFVSAKWVVDSIGCGRRLPESNYKALHAAMKGQESVMGKLTVKGRQYGDVGKP